jgi:hypothetical protein
MAFTMACPNFKKSLKMVFGPLGVKEGVINFIVEVFFHLFFLHFFIITFR